MAQFRINENFMEELNKKMARIEKKCRAHGCGFKYAEVGEVFETVKDKDGNEITTRYVLVEAEGTAVANGWEFVASMEPTPEGNFIDKMIDVEVPKKFWTSGCYCEHCKTKRQRKYLYLVRNTKTGAFKQVGQQCLREYTHGLSAEMAAAIVEMKTTLEEAEHYDVGSGHCRAWLDKVDALTLAFGAVRVFGYARSTETPSTAGKVYEYLDAFKVSSFPPIAEQRRQTREEMAEHNISKDNEADRKDALDALEWLKNQEEDTDYMHNMKLATAGEYFDAGRMGLLVSLVPTWSKAMEREMKIAKRKEEEALEAKNSTHVGKVGDRITVKVEGFRVLASWHNDFGGYYGGYVYLYKFTDENGNIFIWKTSNDVDDSVDTLTGTVKEHSEYNGVKQTVLTRCKTTKK